MTHLRVYDPDECDEQGVPLDWERCRGCRGEGMLPPVDRHYGGPICVRCDGRGSLKVAALAAVTPKYDWSKREHLLVRCEDCGHPMSEGTWELAPGATNLKHIGVEITALKSLVLGAEPSLNRVHYSPCDEGCRHGGPVRDGDSKESLPDTHGTHGAEASWRPVDVRTLGWPHDLRPDRLAVLCLRCWAERNVGAAA